MSLLVSDFDNTLHDSEYRKNAELIKLFLESDPKNLFAIATGRCYQSIVNELKREKEENGIVVPYSYIICSDGASIYDKNGMPITYKNGTTSEKFLNLDTTKKVYTFLQRLALDDNFKDAVSGIRLVTKNGESWDNFDSAFSIAAFFKDKKIGDEVVKFICQKIDGIKGYTSSKNINIINKNVDKSTAIRELTTELKISPSDIYTIGDDINDLEMLTNFNGYALNPKCSELQNAVSAEKVLTHFGDIPVLKPFQKRLVRNCER